jgi:hypothetical protein
MRVAAKLVTEYGPKYGSRRSLALIYEFLSRISPSSFICGIFATEDRLMAAQDGGARAFLLRG